MGFFKMQAWFSTFRQDGFYQVSLRVVWLHQCRKQIAVNVLKTFT